MKKFYQLIALIVCLYSCGVVQAQSTNKKNCVTTEYLAAQIAADPSILTRIQQIEQQTANYAANRGALGTEAVKTIPVVFHVLYNSPSDNISDARLLAQLDVLNKDFAKTNADIGDVPSVFAPLAANTEIQFCLAQRDPLGAPTSGILRTSTTVTSFPYPGNAMKFTAQGGSDAWPRDQYLNIWVCIMGNSILGFAQFPGGAAATDGVVLLTGSVGGVTDPGTAFPYQLGRTGTHEVGHWLNLRHVWGDSFCGNDLVDDTPTQQEDNGGCPSFPHVTCGNDPNGDMFMNYMDYTNDACMNMFTIGQSVRMNAVLAAGGFRTSLNSSLGCVPPSGFTFTSGATASASCPSPSTIAANLSTTSFGGFNTPITLTAIAGVPAGTSISFSVNPVTPGNSTFVTLNNANTLTNGTYNVTVQGVAGAATQTSTVSFVIAAGTAPSLSTVANATVCAGSTASFSVSASGPAVNSYQWQVSTNGGANWTSVSTGTGGTTPMYTTTATTAVMNSYQYRVLATGQCGVATSNAAILAVQTPPTITVQPQNTLACNGSNATFTVSATGTNLTYQWQFSIDGVAPYTTIAGANGISYTAPAVTLAQNNRRYRVIVSGTCPSPVTSAAAILTVGNPPVITAQPANSTLCAGQTATFAVSVTGSSLTYQWLQSVDAGATFTIIPGATNPTLTLPATVVSQKGYRYRVNVFGCTPAPVASNIATLTVNTLAAINTQPTSLVLCEGSNAVYSVAAVGSGATYQWQVSTTGCAGTFANISGAVTNTLTVVNTQATQSGNTYRVVVTGTCNTVTSTCATLVVNTPIIITTQPASTSACLPDVTTAAFSVAVTGTAPTYQWQLSSNGGSSWSNISGATNSILNLTGLSATMTGNQYRVVLNGTCTSGLNSSAATLSVNTKVDITTQPMNGSVCAGSSTSLTVAATGSTITYQWQVSINNGPFLNVDNAGVFTGYTGATSATLGIANATLALNGYRYRVIVSGVPCGSVTSAIATLVVNPLPTAVLVAGQFNRLTPYLNTTLLVTPSPAGNYTYQYKKDGVLVNAPSSSSLPVTIDGFGEYEVTVTDVNGCSSTSNRVRISDSASTTLFIYPNPSRGQFQVRYYRSSTSDNAYYVNVYDGKGARVFSKQFPIAAPYSRMDVNLDNAQSGIYMVEVRDARGKRLASSSVIVSR